jgi:ferritin-like protein
LEMSQKISVDITEICNHLLQEYADEFVEAFQEYDTERQDELCTTVSECKMFELVI